MDYKRRMDAEITIRIGDLQLAALLCHTEVAEDDALDPMPGKLVGKRLEFTAAAAPELCAWLIEAANSADAQYQETPRPDRDARDLRMARSLATLATAVRRAAERTA